MVKGLKAFKLANPPGTVFWSHSAAVQRVGVRRRIVQVRPDRGAIMVEDDDGKRMWWVTERPEDMEVQNDRVCLFDRVTGKRELVVMAVRDAAEREVA